MPAPQLARFWSVSLACCRGLGLGLVDWELVSAKAAAVATADSERRVTGTLIILSMVS